MILKIIFLENKQKWFKNDYKRSYQNFNLKYLEIATKKIKNVFYVPILMFICV